MHKTFAISLCISLTVVFLISCGKSKPTAPATTGEEQKTAPKETPQKETAKPTGIRAFTGKLKSISLPFVYRLHKEDYDPKRVYQPENSDFIEEINIVYGYLADTSQYFYVVTLYPGDDHVPFLHVFDKSGKPVSESALYIGTCGPGCGVHCDEELTISKNLEVYIRAETIAYECNDEGKELTERKEIHQLTTREGKIKDGHLKLREKKSDLLKK